MGKMTNEEAKTILKGMAGATLMVTLKNYLCNPSSDQDKQMYELIKKFSEAVDIAVEALDLMDARLDIEGKSDNNEH